MTIGSFGDIGTAAPDLGREKIFEVRSLYSDVTFIDEFLTEDFVVRSEAVRVRLQRTERSLGDRESHLRATSRGNCSPVMTNAGNPIISAVDANHGNRSELLACSTHTKARTFDWIGRKRSPRPYLASGLDPSRFTPVVDEKPAVASLRWPQLLAEGPLEALTVA